MGLVGMAMLLGVLPAEACVALVTREGGAVATSEAQQVILEPTATGSAVEYANEYSGSAEDFGWIIVVPAPFESLTDGDLSRFDALAAWSQPQVEWVSMHAPEDEGGCGCGGTKASDGAVAGSFRGGDSGANAVEVVAEGFTGTYGYTVVEADDADGLTDWLVAHDWVLGANEAALSEYVDEGGFVFVLVELAPDEPLASGASRQLPPVRVESGSSELMFPARMARDAAPEFQSTRVFVLGDQAATIEGDWSSVELGVLETTVSVPAEDALESAIWDATSDSATYVRVFSGSTEAGWLTRFETRADRDVHTGDVYFVLNGGAAAVTTVVQTWQRSRPSASSMMGLGLLGLAPLFAVGHARRRRRR